MKHLPLLLTCLFLCAFALAGCGQTHLGPHHGDSYRAAFAAQQQSEAPPVAPMDATDARGVMKVHNGDKGDSSSGASRGAVISTSSLGSGGSGGGGGLWQGASGGIKLEAK